MTKIIKNHVPLLSTSARDMLTTSIPARIRSEVGTFNERGKIRDDVHNTSGEADMEQELLFQKILRG